MKGLSAVARERSLVYLRAPIETLTKPEVLRVAASGSVKDTLLFCLLDPPVNRTEPALLDKVRTSYSSVSIVEGRTANARRLDDLLTGLPFLLPAWSEAVRAAPDREAVAQLQREFDKAPIAHARAAARSALLLVVIDEPSDGKGPTELDGERPHPIRLVLLDAATGKVLLRVRKHVDPSFLSVNKRPQYAHGADGCALAFDVGEELAAASSRR
jgi:hypothetical protein